ncbi:MAG: prenyltransferase [Candidatus Binatia bacterium]
MKPLPELLRRLDADHSHAILAFLDRDGSPMSLATGFRADADRRSVALDRPAGDDFVPADGAVVNVLFSHIRPRPGVGYDERRWVSVWGRVRHIGAGLEVAIERAEHWDERELSFFEYCERNVPTAHRYMRELSEAERRPVRPRLSPGWLFLRATRLPFLTATLVSVLLGLAAAARDGFFHWGLALATLVAASAIHLGLNVANDVFDTESGADQANVTPTPFSGGSRVIVYGLLSTRQMVVLAAACYAVGLAIGLTLAWQRAFWPLFWIGAAGVFVSLAYTAPPLRLVHRGLGEAAVALGFGPIMTLGAYAVQTERLSWPTLYASLPIGILIALVLYVNEIPDRRGDAAAGKRTLPVRLRRETVVRGYLAGVAAAFGLIVLGAASGILPLGTIVALAALPLARQVYRGLRSFYENPYALMPAMARNIQLHLVTGLLMVGGYALELFMR